MARMGRRLAMLGAARKYASENSAQVHDGIDKVARAVGGRAPAKHRSKVDSVAAFLKKAAPGTSDGRRAAGARKR